MRANIQTIGATTSTHGTQWWVAVLFLTASAIGVSGCGGGAPAEQNSPVTQRQPASQGPPTFTKDVAPIVFKHCSPCHRPGQGAPFVLLTYKDVQVRAADIGTMIASRKMPPWQPESGYGHFSNERRLSDDQIELIQRWVDDGAPEGDARDLTAAAPAPHGSDWQLGQPDLIAEMPEAYTLQPATTDVFRNFVIPITLPATRYVRAIEFRPRTERSVIHHAVVGLDRTRSSRRLDARDDEPGYDDMLSHEGVQGPDGHFLSWTPGKVAVMEPADMAWRLDPGADLVVQLHMLPSSRKETVRPIIGLYFTDTPPTRQPVLVKLGSKSIDIPAGERAYTVTDTYVLPAEVSVLTIYPHAHFLAKDITATATLPDGAVKPLIWIKDWNFNWQDEYRYAEPVGLPKGTTVTMRYVYDNSAANAQNPHHPPTRVTYGPHSTDEMGDLWLQVLPRSSTGAESLAKDFVERELQANVAGAEHMLRAMPRHLEALNWAATSYMRIGKPQEALRHLREAIRVYPQNAEVRHNLGSVLLAMGQGAEALAQFRIAVRLNPRDDRMQLSLANTLNASGAAMEAMQVYRQTIAANPDSAEAHNNLGILLGSQEQIDEAIVHFRRALEIEPDYADAHNNLGIALGSRGDIDEALTHFRRALQLHPGDASATENLNALLEITGRVR